MCSVELQLLDLVALCTDLIRIFSDSCYINRNQIVFTIPDRHAVEDIKYVSFEPSEDGIKLNTPKDRHAAEDREFDIVLNHLRMVLSW